MKSNVVAVIGGGQLARMMQQAAGALDIRLRALVEAPDGPTAQVVPEAFVGRPSDEIAVRQLLDCPQAERLALTFEHEHQDPQLLARLAADGVRVQPSGSALRFARDKLLMRRRLAELDVPMPKWCQVTDEVCLADFLAEQGGIAVVKTARGGYDGKGVRIVTEPGQVADWLHAGYDLIAEAKVNFTTEVAALLARRESGQIAHWELTQTIQSDGVCVSAIAPAPGVGRQVRAQARQIAETIATGLAVTGVLAVEMFLVDGQLLVNELAMRPHNSGHWTIEGAVTSQFEQHLRAVLDLPLGDPSLTGRYAAMVNLLGANAPDLAASYSPVLGDFPEVKVHLYGKEVRPGRKIGHVTAVGEDPKLLLARCRAVASGLTG